MARTDRLRKSAPNSRLVFGTCIAVSLGLHALLLLGPWSKPAMPRGTAIPSNTTVLHGRVLDKPASVAPSEAPPQEIPPVAMPAPPAVAQPKPTLASVTEPAATPAVPAPLRDPQIEPPVPSPVAPPAAEASAGPPTTPASAPPGALDGYIPRPLLTEPPILLAPVLIEEPAAQPSSVGARVGVLALFIDDKGRVQEVVAEAPFLPEEYEKAARKAFLAARYTPGKLDGRTVKSRVRVEVTFDGTPSLR